MKRLFEIDENEKRRILEMHENATKKLYLSEQPATLAPEQGAPVQGTPGSVTTGPTEINGVTYNMPEINSQEVLDKFLSVNPSVKMQFAKRLKFMEIPDKMQDRIFQAIIDGLKYGAQKYRGFASNICTGGLKLENLMGASPMFDLVAKDYPNIMDVFIPVAKSQAKKLGVKMRCD